MPETQILPFFRDNLYIYHIFIYSQTRYLDEENFGEDCLRKNVTSEYVSDVGDST